MNFMPGQQGSKAVIEGLFGLKMGARFQKVGVFGKVRPGFIYYQDAMQGGGNMTPNSLTRFATDFGGVFEYYPEAATPSCASTLEPPWCAISPTMPIPRSIRWAAACPPSTG